MPSGSPGRKLLWLLKMEIIVTPDAVRVKHATRARWYLQPLQKLTCRGDSRAPQAAAWAQGSRATGPAW